MANLNWKQLVVAGLIAVAGATGAYYYLQSQNAGHSESESVIETSEVANVGKKSKRRKSKKTSKSASKSPVASASSESSSQDSIVSDINTAKVSVEKSVFDLAVLVEKDSDELQKLDVEQKQKVFYALLLKGEAKMNQQEADNAVEYFSKALVLVPNPSEILAAFEKTLPEPIFTALLQNLQNQVLRKTHKYYEMLAKPTDGRVVFEMLNEVDLLGKPVKRFVPKAKKEIKKGEIIYQEAADVLALVDLSMDATLYCDHCLKKLDEETKVVCDKDETAYCSESCKKSSFEIHHMYVCAAREDAHEAVQELAKYCQEESKSGAAMLMLRYVSMLLTEELKGHGADMNGPFVNFDHLPQLFPAPTAIDKHEASLIRRVFTNSNENLAEFLTDQIYASMKATLGRAAFSFSLYNPLALNNQDNVEAFRKVIGENQDCEATGFYPLSAHLPHACSPNVALELIPDSGCKIRCQAMTDIAEGEELNISFVPVEHMEQQMRQEKLFLNFMLECKCKPCVAEEQ